MSESKSTEESKPFRISKWEVWEAYQKVKAQVALIAPVLRTLFISL